MKYFFNTIKKSRGFSLVELLVVVAIMGTLATIAIPAYNNYRQQAKKAAYRMDVSSLHKGWLAFGVEIDSFCERETTPVNASFSTVGLGGLLTSNLYGKNVTTSTDAKCMVGSPGVSTPANLRPRGCTASSSSNPCSSCSAGTFTPHIPAGNGPGKENFIGFGTVSGTGFCPNMNATEEYLHIVSSDASTVTDTGCELKPTSYKMGSFGHISGDKWIGHQVTNTGIITERNNQNKTDHANTCT